MGFKARALALGVAAALAGLSGQGDAANSHVITVNATVNGNCKFQSSASTITLAVDASATIPATGSSSVTYRCTKGTTPTFLPSSTSTSSPSTGLLTGPSPLSTDSFAYTYSTTSGGAGTGLGNNAANNKTFTVTVSVDPAAGAADVSPGTYSDTITINVTP
jgi:spore coat protein U-like protein